MKIFKIKPITICANCKNYLLDLEDQVEGNHVCKAKPYPRAIDPVDGKEKCYAMWKCALGVHKKFFHTQQYKDCSFINFGNCILYEVIDG
jgi:hypothetical protein